MLCVCEVLLAISRHSKIYEKNSGRRKPAEQQPLATISWIEERDPTALCSSYIRLYRRISVRRLRTTDITSLSLSLSDIDMIAGEKDTSKEEFKMLKNGRKR